MTKKEEKYQQKLNKRFPNEKLQVIEYTGCKNHSVVQCLSCGQLFQFEKAESSYKKNKHCLCKKCGELAQRKKSFIARLQEKYPYDDLEVLQFDNTHSYCKIRCKKCGTVKEYQQAEYACNHITDYFCHTCVPSKKKQHDATIVRFLNFVSNIENGWLLTDNISTNIDLHSDLVSCKCLECGEINHKNIYDYLRGIKCACKVSTRPKNNQVFQECLEDGYTLISDYKNIYGKVLIKHECGFCYTVTARACWKGYGKCPKCHKKTSKGEQQIKKLLEQNSIDFIREYPVKIKNHNLRFDFYLPILDIFIEYNGIQHYKAIDYFGGVERLQKQQYFDELKRQYANEKLIIIKYDEDIKKSFENKILKFND